MFQSTPPSAVRARTAPPPSVVRKWADRGIRFPIGHVSVLGRSIAPGCPRQSLVRLNVQETEPMRSVYPQNCKNDGKLWPEYGAGWLCRVWPGGEGAPRNPRWRAGVASYGGLRRFYGTRHRRFLSEQKTVTDMVDIEQSYRLYTTPHWRAAARSDGASSKLLTDIGDRSPTTGRGRGLRRFPGFGEGFLHPGLFDR